MRTLFGAVLLCGILALAGSAGSATAGDVPGPLHLLKGKVWSDGVLTVGQPETVVVSKMVRKAKVDIAIASEDGPQCAGHRLCSTDGLPPAPGAAPFRTNGKGRATLTFVVPATYESFDFDAPSAPFLTYAFVNGATVHLAADTSRLRHNKITLAFADSPAAVEVPPPPPTP